MEPDATTPEVTASESNAGPSHRLTSAAVVFNLIDRNGDGEIDREEASTLFDAIFTTLDANDDGKLSKDEINSALHRMSVGGREWHGYNHHHEDRRHR
jgi:Ca2+-binding EF-hand superfamily protein